MKTFILYGILILAMTGCRSRDVVSPGVDNAESQPATDSHLLRSHDQSAHASDEIYRAAGRVFTKTTFVALSETELEKLIGSPLKEEGLVWFYSFHTGWIGHQRRFHFNSAGKVEQVEVVPTQ